MSAPLACPICGSTALLSNEAATISYPVNVYADNAVEYLGGSYSVNDEGTECSGDFMCSPCGWAGREHELVPDAEAVDA